MRKAILITVGGLGMVALLALAAVVRGNPADGERFEPPTATREDLEEVAAKSVFFAHQSVGYNMLDAHPGVFDEFGVAAPPIVESRDEPTGPGIVHTRIGQNGDPLGKIAEFDQIMRDGMAEAVDVAVLKLCYVDFREGTDVVQVFRAYRDTISELARDYPGTTFVAVTAPLTTERGPLGKVKGVLGRGDNLGPEHNVVREHFNSLMRAEYTDPGTLFDIASVQSTEASGDRVAYERRGELYYAMNEDYSSDPGHLNAAGGAAVTSAFLSVLADALA